MVYLHLGSPRARTLQFRRTATLFIAGLVALAVGSYGHYAASPEEELALAQEDALAIQQESGETTPAQVVARVADEVQALAESAMTPEPQQMTRQIELGKGRAFSKMLVDADIGATQAFAISTAMSKVYDPRHLRAGQEFVLTLTRKGSEVELDSVTFSPEPTKEVSVVRKASGNFFAQLKNTPLERRRVAAQGTIKNSLYGAGEKAGVPRGIMAALIRAYSHEMDFQRDIHSGDKFEVLYDQPTARDGKAVGQGVIIYASLKIQGKAKPIYRVTFGDGAVDYFNEKGQSVRRSLLRTPVEGARVTSRFGMRRHPLLGYSKMHKGVDFGAPRGTPIYAAGSGVVEKAKYYGSYGKFVMIRHNSRVKTAYAHMKRFAKGIRRGARVNQGDVIGYVGSTGRSTGPHLHFEVRINGKQVNPLGASMPVGRVLKGKTLVQFKKGQAKIKHEFASLLKKGDSESRKAAAPSKEEIKKTSSIPDKSAASSIKVALRSKK